MKGIFGLSGPRVYYNTNNARKVGENEKKAAYVGSGGRMRKNNFRKKEKIRACLIRKCAVPAD
jgi:hypothetical protein